jgi:hypothetical protein
VEVGGGRRDDSGEGRGDILRDDDDHKYNEKKQSESDGDQNNQHFECLDFGAKERSGRRR